MRRRRRSRKTIPREMTPVRSGDDVSMGCGCLVIMIFLIMLPVAFSLGRCSVG